ncbi:MAG: diacylglycerol kinase family lipid kinase [Halanaerobiales bacterium]|nr:diacylglycerol kinase family lipid kinase [Halanaerobiales bacterium]MCF8008382.1 diacylglycerol kinase family lipid kinase [Halanaerobiales bacterium]
MINKNVKDNTAKENTIFTIVNPVSSNGKTKKRWPTHQKEFEKNKLNLKIKETLYPGHAIELTKEALLEGYQTIMAVGGDGTVNEVVNGFFNNGKLINEKAVLLVFSQGTGSDYIKTLGLKKEVAEVIKTYHRYKKRWVDLGKVKYLDFDHNQIERYFINTADAGLGGATVEYVNRSSKVMGGLITYIWGVIRTLITYKNKEMELKVDQKVIKKGVLNSVMVSLGKYFGGGMHIAPEALIDDGFFDIVILGNLNKIETILNLYKAYKGTHIYYPKIDYIKGKKIVLDSDQRVLIDIDGECAGLLPAEFSLREKDFPILC